MAEKAATVSTGDTIPPTASGGLDDNCGVAIGCTHDFTPKAALTAALGTDQTPLAGSRQAAMTRFSEIGTAYSAATNTSPLAGEATFAFIGPFRRWIRAACSSQSAVGQAGAELLVVRRHQGGFLGPDVVIDSEQEIELGFCEGEARSRRASPWPGPCR